MDKKNCQIFIKCEYCRKKAEYMIYTDANVVYVACDECWQQRKIGVFGFEDVWLYRIKDDVEFIPKVFT